MDYLDYKYEFLKHVKTIDKNLFIKLVNDYIEEPLPIYNFMVSYTAHNTNTINSNEAEVFLHKYYRTWYHSFTKRFENGQINNPKHREIAKDFLSDSTFIPANVKNMKFVDIYNEIKHKYKMKVVTLQSDNNKESFIGIYNSFLHLRTNILFPSFSDEEKVDARLYLNLECINIIPFTNIFLSRLKENKETLHFKISSDDKRSDNVVIYTNYRQISRIVNIIDSIKNDYPNLFKGSEKVSPFLANVNGYIGFAEEPNDRQSYTDSRGRFIFDAYSNYYQDNSKDATSYFDLSSYLRKSSRDYDIYNLKLLFLNSSSVEELINKGYDINLIGSKYVNKGHR